jgi:hypothetical protein
MYNIVTIIIVATFYLFFKQTSKVKQLITLSWFHPSSYFEKHYSLLWPIITQCMGYWLCSLTFNALCCHWRCEQYLQCLEHVFWINCVTIGYWTNMFKCYNCNMLKFPWAWKFKGKVLLYHCWLLSTRIWKDVILNLGIDTQQTWNNKVF